ncbi:DUF3159 domain-containing protein [Nocardia sp. NBC_01503]|uniref:DUF3159 domain-containing protein n=1 Tax=Nocardia sp. NBC_01503 TaxID=2975997 RepID=UPI002E7B40C7|nr:DUF3159 domain-containing protein [Nocardia sp. NBC_01503]WTL30060.1 DUF3159 domain-containing protein [Nocardia sp. NBC_01503]
MPIPASSNDEGRAPAGDPRELEDVFTDELTAREAELAGAVTEQYVVQHPHGLREELEELHEEEVEQTLLEQLGGFSGLIYSSLPVLVFVPVNSLRGLTTAIWAALGVATAILIWRLVRRGPIQPAISGFLGVGVCAFIAYRMGEAKGFFLFGIYASLVYSGAFLVSLVVRWPLAGVIWGVLNGHGTEWRSDRRAMRLYDLATVVWAVVFGARYLVQNHLYDSNSTGLLAVARLAMGWPLTAVALVVTVWAVRKAGHLPVSTAKTAKTAAPAESADSARN